MPKKRETYREYSKSPQRSAIGTADYICSIYCISTFVVLAFRGLLLHYRGTFSLVIWLWLSLLVLFFMKFSQEVSGINFLHDVAMRKGFSWFVFNQYITPVMLIFTSLIILNLWRNFIKI